MRYRHSGLILALLLLASPLLAEELNIDPLEMQTIQQMQSVIISVEAYKLDNDIPPGPTDGFVTVEFLIPHVEPLYIRSLPVNDAWGNPFAYWSDGEHYIVASYGADGLPDREYAGVMELEISDDDFVTLDGTEAAVPLHMHHMAQAGKQKLTMADMRSIATALEAFKIDNGACPGATPGEVEVAWIREYVQPIYIRTLPLNDAWGRPFLFWSDGESYRIASLGSDGILDRSYEEIVPRTGTQLFTADIVFENGEFMQYPEGEQR
jgi:type II secretory pathway pseudopilin PulG